MSADDQVSDQEKTIKALREELHECMRTLQPTDADSAIKRKVPDGSSQMAVDDDARAASKRPRLELEVAIPVSALPSTETSGSNDEVLPSLAEERTPASVSEAYVRLEVIRNKVDKCKETLAQLDSAVQKARTQLQETMLQLRAAQKRLGAYCSSKRSEVNRCETSLVS